MWLGSEFNCLNLIFVKAALQNHSMMEAKWILKQQEDIYQLEMLHRNKTSGDMDRFADFRFSDGTNHQLTADFKLTTDSLPTLLFTLNRQIQTD